MAYDPALMVDPTRETGYQFPVLTPEQIQAGVMAPFQSQPAPSLAPPANDTYAWGYAPPSYLEGERPVPIPAGPPGMDVPANQPYRLPSGVVAYRETVGHRQRLMELERQQAAARQAAQQAAMDAKMFEQMSRVAKSTRDIEIARRSIDVMGLQRDIQSGVPIHQAVARHPLALGSAYGSALRAVTPEAAPFNPVEVTLPSGAKGVRTGRYGEQFHYAPSPLTEESRSRVGTEMTTPSGLRAIWVGPNQIRLTENKETKELTPAQLLTYAETLQYSPNATNRAKATAILDFIGERVQKQISPPPVVALGGATGTIHPLPSDKSKRVKGQLYETPKGAAEWTGDGWILRETK